MKINFDAVIATKLSDKVVRKRVIGNSLEVILYTYKAGATFAHHKHEAEQLTIVLEGELVFVFYNEEVRLKTNEMILIPSLKPHGAYVPEGKEVTKTYNIFTPIRKELPLGG